MTHQHSSTYRWTPGSIADTPEKVLLQHDSSKNHVYLTNKLTSWFHMFESEKPERGSYTRHLPHMYASMSRALKNYIIHVTCNGMCLCVCLLHYIVSSTSSLHCLWLIIDNITWHHMTEVISCFCGFAACVTQVCMKSVVHVTACNLREEP